MEILSLWVNTHAPVRGLKSRLNLPSNPSHNHIEGKTLAKTKQAPTNPVQANQLKASQVQANTVQVKVNQA